VTHKPKKLRPDLHLRFLEVVNRAKAKPRYSTVAGGTRKFPWSAPGRKRKPPMILS